MSTFNHTVTLPAKLVIATGDTKLDVTIDLQALAAKWPHIFDIAVLTGFTKTLTDIGRGKDDVGAPCSDVEWHANREKKAIGWMNSGQWSRGGERETSTAAEIIDLIITRMVSKGIHKNKKAARDAMTAVLPANTKLTALAYVRAIIAASMPKASERDREEAVGATLAKWEDAVEAQRREIAARAAELTGNISLADLLAMD